MNRLKNSKKYLALILHSTEKNYNHRMFEFLKKPNHLELTQNSDREIPIESTDEPHGEDIGQIAVDILETQE